MRFPIDLINRIRGPQGDPILDILVTKGITDAHYTVLEKNQNINF